MFERAIPVRPSLDSRGRRRWNHRSSPRTAEAAADPLAGQRPRHTRRRARGSKKKARRGGRRRSGGVARAINGASSPRTRMRSCRRLRPRDRKRRARHSSARRPTDECSSLEALVSFSSKSAMNAITGFADGGRLGERRSTRVDGRESTRRARRGPSVELLRRCLPSYERGSQRCLLSELIAAKSCDPTGSEHLRSQYHRSSNTGRGALLLG
jgi:hypothetical protein